MKLGRIFSLAGIGTASLGGLALAAAAQFGGSDPDASFDGPPPQDGIGALIEQLDAVDAVPAMDDGIGALIEELELPPTPLDIQNAYQPNLALDNGNFLSFGEVQNPVTPQAFNSYCFENIEDCRLTSEEYNMVTDIDVMARMYDINREVNAITIPQDDEITYGRLDYWIRAQPGDGEHAGFLVGDCEDHVLEKMYRFEQELGIPASAMSMIIVDPHIEGSDSLHAVLAVRTGNGDYIFDNLNDDMQFMHETRYTPMQGQAFANNSLWQKVTITPVGEEAAMGDLPDPVDITMVAQEPDDGASPVAPPFLRQRPPGL